MKLNKIAFLLSLTLVMLAVTACTAPITGGFPAGSVDKDTLYVSVGNAVLAVRSDGTQVWRYPLTVDANKTFFAAPALINGQVVVGDYANVLFGLDATNGTEKWNYADAKGRWMGGLMFADDKLIAPNGDGNVYALDASGKFLWKSPAKAGFFAGAVYDGKLIYAASMDHFLYAINPSDGSQAWKLDLEGPVIAAPVLTKNGMLFVGTMANKVLGVKLSTQEIAWRADTTGQVWGATAVSNNVVYVGDLANKFYALNADTGAQLWVKDMPGPVVASPAVLPEGLAVVCETGELTIVSFKNEQLWTDKITTGKLYSTPITIGERLILPVYQGDPILQTYDFSGRKGWTLAAPK